MRGSLVPGVRFGRHSPVVDLLESSARDGSRRLLLWPGGEWTVDDLARHARACAVALQDRGVQPGDRVAIVSGNSAERLAWQFGIWWMGAVEVSVNSELRGPLLENVLVDSDPRLVLTAAEFVEILPPVAADLLVMEDVELPTTTAAQDAALDEVARSLAPEGLGTILYTSGTTGPSKGVMLPRAYFSNHGAILAGCLEFTPDDVGYFIFPFFHVDAHIVIAGTVQAGATMAFDRRFSARRWWPQIIEWKATWAFYIGAVASVVMATGDGCPPGPTRLRRLWGGPTPRAAFAHFEDKLGIPLYSLYGQTEADGPLIGLGGRYPRSTVGSACVGFDVEIHDEHGNVMPPGVSGEIVYRPQHANLMTLGYWRRAEATVEAFRGLWFHSGDLGSMDAEGFVTFEGRLTDSLRRRGENISALEIEAVMNGAPHVRETVAVPVEDEMGGEDEIKVFVVPASDAFSAEEFFRYCEENLPRYAVPAFIEITMGEAFVRAVGNGNIHKRHLSRATSGPAIHSRPRELRSGSVS